MTDSHADLRQAVATANNELAEADLVVAAFGNASQADHDSGVFAIKPSGIPCSRVTRDDIVVLTIDGGEQVWGQNRPSSDTPTHRVIYAGIDQVGGVVHTHSLFATSWAQSRKPIPCFGTTHADHFRGPVPVTRPLTSDEIGRDYEASTGAAIVEMFSKDGFDPVETPGALVASHGPFAWAEDASSAVETAAAMEFIARLATQTLSIAAEMRPIEEELLERHFLRKHGPAAYYGQP